MYASMKTTKTKYVKIQNYLVAPVYSDLHILYTSSERSGLKIDMNPSKSSEKGLGLYIAAWLLFSFGGSVFIYSSFKRM